jgi:hypothetical protein
VSSAGSRDLDLKAIVSLTFDSKVNAAILRRVRGQESFAVLTSSAVRFVIDDPTAQEREFDQFRSLVDCCPIFELLRPRDLAALDQSVDYVRALLMDESAFEGSI